MSVRAANYFIQLLCGSQFAWPKAWKRLEHALWAKKQEEVHGGFFSIYVQYGFQGQFILCQQAMTRPLSK